MIDSCKGVCFKFSYLHSLTMILHISVISLISNPQSKTTTLRRVGVVITHHPFITHNIQSISVISSTIIHHSQLFLVEISITHNTQQ
ncbi:hypothetical protein HanRHA438_Chr06g0266601 [Helianthus annuus]|nr:hypothetical protein HanRHA438_Chr06g0266601 [Helianthus annuus]